MLLEFEEYNKKYHAKYVCLLKNDGKQIEGEILGFREEKTGELTSLLVRNEEGQLNISLKDVKKIIIL